MNKLKTGKGALKDYHRCLADEYDDYAEEPEYYDPISHFTNSNGSQIKTASGRLKPAKRSARMTYMCPKFKPNFNFEAASGGFFDGPWGKRLAMFLSISDVLKLLRTCRYFYKIFSNASIWRHFLFENYGDNYLLTDALSSINIMQYLKYSRCSTSWHLLLNRRQKKNHDGIVFDTLLIEKDMRIKEEKDLVRNVVDFVTAKTQKTIDTINKVAVTGTFTEDVKISWVRETSQVCVWVTGYHVQSSNMRTFACILFNKKYKGESQLIQKAYFLNDRYFVVEIEEKSECGVSVVQTFEVYLIEPEHDWFEKKHISLCKQVLKESFAAKKTGNMKKVKSIGDFLVFVLEREDKKLCVQVFDVNGGKCLHKSEDLDIEAGLNDIMASRSVDKSSFNLYLRDSGSDIYVVNYSLELGVTIKKIHQPEKVQEEEDKVNKESNERFANTMKKYHYEIYQKINRLDQSKTSEFFMIYKERRFYFVNLQTNELINCDLPGFDISSNLFNWTICGEYLYLLLDTTIQIYQLDCDTATAILHKKEVIIKTKVTGSSARLILANPCLTIIVSARSFDEGLMGSLQVLIGSTQYMLAKAEGMNNRWSSDECRLDSILGKVEKWQDIASLGKEVIECKFEDERLLIQTNVRSYFRDFSVCERRVDKNLHEWKNHAIFDLDEPVGAITSIEQPSSEALPRKEKEKPSFVKSLVVQENKNHNRKMKKSGSQNWKNVEKKAETEETIEKRENRKKGDKYYKNARQGKHREKMLD